MSGDHNQYQKPYSYLDFECPRCGHCCQGYELGFVDGMQHQMKSSVDKALNEKREPVAWRWKERINGDFDSWAVTFSEPPPYAVEQQPLYTAPPKREWVGLTADEIWKCNKAKSGSAVEFHICYEHQNVEDFAEAIEAKLREKNT
jgi:hypothetical protein